MGWDHSILLLLGAIAEMFRQRIKGEESLLDGVLGMSGGSIDGMGVLKMVKSIHHPQSSSGTITSSEIDSSTTK